jgi:hypothetical protein
MNPLAEAIYELLRRRVGQDDPRITYAELARGLREADPAFDHVTHRSKELYAALWEVGNLCRARRMPPLPALVVRADTRRPGDAYFDGAEETYSDDRIAAWRRDFDAVRAAQYQDRRG